MFLENEFRDFSIRDLGFEKYVCRKCGSSFWSRVYREYCPDRPCSKYEFLYREYPSVKRLSLDDARTSFIEYFKSKGHGYIEPYPVVAKWRDDLYLTIASIVVFQPLVTNGVIEPPYNPLVIVQPCVRLEDIDNVGLTFGRHMSSFEMGGHHAFNKRDKHIYWIRETIDYSLDFFTRVVGIPIDSIVYKESWWEGGGNAGPALEVLVDGLELATLVFMKYRVVEGKYVPNPVSVVDTGYGIERIAWFTQRTPTAYHSVFTYLINEYEEILNIETIPDDVLLKIIYLTSDRSISSINELGRVLYEYNLGEYINKIQNVVALYTTLDHVKTLLLLLSNNVVPSNTGEGYLARLVLRRLLKTILKTNVEIHRLADVLIELIDKQINYWRDRYVYRAFSDKSSYIHEVASIETSKFIDSITRGVAIVDKLISKREVSTEVLYKIYDSYGIPPEIVVERARTRGLDIELPSDFYSRVARLHSSVQEFSKEKTISLSREVVEWASKFNYTQPVFQQDPYRREHRARILSVFDKYIIFDSTIFYPKSGGQDNDTGYIIYRNEKYRVNNVFKVGDVIVHELDRRIVIDRDEYVEQYIDWFRRYHLMKHHTATHILLGVLRKLYGEHVWQAGAEKSIEKARLDVTLYKVPSSEEIEFIEKEVNKIVDQRIDLVFKYMDKFSAEREYGVKIYQGGVVYSPVIRVVEIPGLDVEACFGTHVYNTSEVGGFKITKVDKIQDGVIRFEYIAGTRLPEYLAELSNEREKVLRITGFSSDNLVKSVENLLTDFRNMQELVKNYRNLLKEYLIKEIVEKTINICNVPLVVIEKKVADQQLYKNIVEELSLKNNYLTILLNNNIVEIAVKPEIASSSNIDLRKIMDILKSKYPDAKGGGKRDHVIIRLIKPVDKIKDIVQAVENIICQNKTID